MKSDLKRIKYFSRTCLACPSQWEGSLEDGNFVYIRYRGAKFKAYIAPNEREWLEDCEKYKIYELDTKQDQYDGYMPDDVMKWLLGFVFDFKSIEGPYEGLEIYDEGDLI